MSSKFRSPAAESQNWWVINREFSGGIVRHIELNKIADYPPFDHQNRRRELRFSDPPVIVLLA